MQHSAALSDIKHHVDAANLPTQFLNERSYNLLSDTELAAMLLTYPAIVYCHAAPGKGKTREATRLMAEVMYRRVEQPADAWRFYYVSGTSLFAECERTKYDRDADLRTIVERTKLLVIDDIDADKNALTFYGNLLLLRSDASRPTIITYTRQPFASDSRVFHRLVEAKELSV